MLRRRPLMRMAATTAVVAGTATAVSGGVRRHQEAKAQDQQNAAAPVAEAAPSEEDKFAQLKQLGDLHAQGILTDEEFAAEKAKLLG
jgi:negative regulator of sigma E activity